MKDISNNESGTITTGTWTSIPSTQTQTFGTTWVTTPGTDNNAGQKNVLVSTDKKDPKMIINAPLNLRGNEILHDTDQPLTITSTSGIIDFGGAELRNYKHTVEPGIHITIENMTVNNYPSNQ